MTDTETSGNNSAIVAIVALVFILIAGFFAYQNGMFGGREKTDNINIEMTAPVSNPPPAAPAAPDNTPAPESVPAPQ